ncbi:uncharacterized protein LOC141859808 isoform X3 [Acropora palmata]|uniref:uncharacterized protein LOC141859808 isoform X3 n=1 Tax=Acropora palmata TaxID=6131 RepID=UPI003DA06513
MLLPARAIVKVRCIVLLPSSFLWQVLECPFLNQQSRERASAQFRKRYLLKRERAFVVFSASASQTLGIFNCCDIR